MLAFCQKTMLYVANKARNGIVSIDRQINLKLLLELSVRKNVIDKEQFTVEGRKHTYLRFTETFNQTQ